MIETGGAEARERLSAALGVARWVDEVGDAGPYPSVEALIEAGDRAAADLTDAELDEAVARHQRIGEDASSDGTAARSSAEERGGLGAAAEGVDAGLARGSAVYEERFGRGFLIRAAGRSRQEILDELQRRLLNDPAAEAAEAKEQLRQIAALRLGTLFADDA